MKNVIIEKHAKPRPTDKEIFNHLLKQIEKHIIKLSQLKGDKDILITKAISWLLRDLIKHHREQVVYYLDKNSDNLPKIAIRETKNKLITGKK